MTLFESDDDRRSQEEVRAILEKAFSMNVHSCGRLSEIDFVMDRGGPILAVAELKDRKNSSTQYPTVFLSLRKWYALIQHAFPTACAALFVARFTDCVKFIRLDKVDARRNHYFTARRVYRCESDSEAVIEVPIAEMTTLHVFAEEQAEAG